MIISDEFLLDCAKRGIIAGPSETEDAFLKRAALLSPLFTTLVSPHYQMRVDWAPVSYEGKEVRSWEAGCALIEENGTAVVEINPRLQRAKPFWGYSHCEVIHHEIVHLIRSQFNEPRFEEALAYATSSKKWRRVIGPLFSHVWEPLIFVIAPLFPLFALALGGYFSLKLSVIHVSMKKVRKKLSALFVEPERVLLLLTDKEIRAFRKRKEGAISEYCEGNQTLRWRQIKLLDSVRE